MKMPGHFLAPAGAVLLLLTSPACFSDATSPLDSTSTGVTTVTPVTTATTTAAPTTGDDVSTTEASAAATTQDPTSDPTGATKLDLGGTTGFGMDSEGSEGCNKVDLLFVIDNSLSMAAEQDSLIASFPGFISEIQRKLTGAGSYHVGVITTDAYAGNAEGCTELGALVTRTLKATCGPYAAGAGYMTEADDLATAFTCAAKVGITGANNEQPIAAADLALSAALAAPGACNAGFLRDDALLVLTIITDEEDDSEGKGKGSPGDPPTWFDALVAHKGLEANIVALAVVGGAPGNMCPPYSPPTGAEDAPRLRAFAELFTYGAVGDVCADSYDGFFQAAIATIATACQNFDPPG